MTNEGVSPKENLTKGVQYLLATLGLFGVYATTEGDAAAQEMFALLTVITAVCSADDLMTYARKVREKR